MFKRFLMKSILILLLLLAGCSAIEVPIIVTATPDFVTETPLWMPTDTATATATASNTPTATNTTTATATATATIEPTPTREVLDADCSRISYNINGLEVPDRAYLLAHLERLDPCVVLVMDDLGLAVQIHEMLGDAIVISRSFNRAEGEEWLQRSPQDFVAQWIRDGHPEIVRYSTNEPSLFNLTGFLQTERDLMKRAREAGFTLCVGNFGVGRYQPGDIDAGLFDGYLRDIVRYGHYLCPHEYTTAVTANGTAQWARDCLLHRECVQPEHWPTVDQLPIARIPYPIIAQGTAIPWGLEEYEKLYGVTAQAAETILPPYWHLLRSAWFLIRADAIGIDRPQIILTEAFWDNMDDISDVVSQLKARYGLSAYMGDMRGINSYSRLWAYYWPEWTQAQAACEQLLYVNEIYPDDYLGFTLFTWSQNIHWISFDMSSRQGAYLRDLHTMLERRDCAA